MQWFLTEKEHSEEFYTFRKDPDSPTCTHTYTDAQKRSHSQATAQHPLKSPKSQIRLPWAPLSYLACANERCVLEQCEPLGRAETSLAHSIYTAALWTSLAPTPATVGQNSCCVLTQSLPHPLMLSRSAIICYAPTQTCKNRPSQSTDKPSHSVLKPWHHDHLTSAWNSSLI